MDNTKFECPVCHAELNSSGKPFVSVRAIALHVSGKIITGCIDHRIWAYENCGQEEINQAVDQAKPTNGINVIAELLLVPVKRWHDDNAKRRIGFKV